MAAENLLYWIWLTSLYRMTPSKISRIMKRFSSPKEVYETAAEEIEAVKDISTGMANILTNKSLERAEQIIEQSEECGAQIITIEDENYPAPFKSMEVPPYVLYMKGKQIDWDSYRGITIIGTRRCTQYGLDAARFFAETLTQAGLTVVSGMADGIDGAAAEAAMDAGGDTIAVLGSGINVIYPKNHVELYNRIAEEGVIISEFAPGSKPYPQNFPLRNRLMSALGEASVVVEAPHRSGALITASHALSMGRVVYAVPGSIFSDKSVGVNELIRDGAQPVSHPSEILFDFGLDFEEAEKTPASNYATKEIYASAADMKKRQAEEKKEKSKLNENNTDEHEFVPEEVPFEAELDMEGLSEEEQQVLKFIADSDRCTADEIARALDMKINVLNNTLVGLEIDGRIEKLAGNGYKLKV